MGLHLCGLYEKKNIIKTKNANLAFYSISMFTSDLLRFVNVLTIIYLKYCIQKMSVRFYLYGDVFKWKLYFMAFYKAVWMEMLHIQGVYKLTIHNFGCDRTQLDEQ